VPYIKVQFADGSQPEQNWKLTAHSVLKDGDGWLFDITPIADTRVRPSLRFVQHIGDEQLFQSMMQSKHHDRLRMLKVVTGRRFRPLLSVYDQSRL